MNDLVVFYHKGTVDGRISACIMKMLKPDAEYIPVDFTSGCRFTGMDVSHKDVYILGFPLHEKLWDSLIGYASLTYISRQSDFVPISDLILSLTTNDSTFVSLWHHLFPDRKLPLIYQHINSYLCGGKKDNADNMLGYYVCTILSFHSTLSKFSEKLAQLIVNVENMHLSAIYSEGHSHSKTIQSLAKHLLDNAVESDSIQDVFGVPCLIVNIPKIFNVFIKEYLFERCDNVLTYGDSGTTRYWSFHSKSLDAKDVAKVFKGFGDSLSSGFNTDQNIYYKDLNEVWENK